MLVKAKSKLYLAGEYAVLNSSSYAIIVSVDKYTYIDIEKNEQEIVISSVVDKDNILKYARDIAFEYVGYYENFKYTYTTDLYDNNKKMGLGSSASITVLTIKAILEYLNIEYNKDTLFRLSVKALKKAGIKGSMGDVAAICYEGLILYKSIDDKGNYEIKNIELKKDLNITAYWTKLEASTSKQISNMENIKKMREFDVFVKKSDEYCLEMYDALISGNNNKLYASIKNLRKNLEYFEKFSNIEIHSKEIKEKIKGVNYKSSGAGKGDFVISLDMGEKYEKRPTYRICFRM